MDLTFYVCLLSGLLSGLISGLLGLGGGVVTVPFLYFIFLHSGMFPDELMQIAVSTSLASSFVTSLTSTLLQVKKKAVVFSVLKNMVPTLVLGCVIGSLTAYAISSQVLRFCFAWMAVLMGGYFSFPKLPNLYISSAPNRSLLLFSLLIGFLSSILGIGGGSIAFPILLGYQIAPKNASATSSAATLITTGIGSIAFLVIAFHNPKIPHTFGYIHLPAFFAVCVGAILTAPIGVKLSHALPLSQIKTVFGLSLVCVGIAMLAL